MNIIYRKHSFVDENNCDWYHAGNGIKSLSQMMTAITFQTLVIFFSFQITNNGST